MKWKRNDSSTISLITEEAGYLFGRFVKVEAGRDELVALLGALDEVLPLARDAVDDVAERLALRVAQAHRRGHQQRFGLAQALVGRAVRPLDRHLSANVAKVTSSSCATQWNQTDRYSRIRLYHPRDISFSRLYWPFSAGTEFFDKLKLSKHGASQRSAAEQLNIIGFGRFHNTVGI